MVALNENYIFYVLPKCTYAKADYTAIKKTEVKINNDPSFHLEHNPLITNRLSQL